MLNIVTHQFNHTCGPKKVVDNLIKGLQNINYPFVINKEINSTSKVFMPNGMYNLLALNKKTESEVIIGPNIFDLPVQKKIPRIIYPKLKYVDLLLVPSKWYYELYSNLNYKKTPVSYWPVGIDTDEFMPTTNKNKQKILIYHKNRAPKELKKICAYLDELNADYYIFDPRKGYKENEFKQALTNTKFAIWHSFSETQGIAYQECLSCNIPMIVFDIKKQLQQNKYYHQRHAKYYKDFLNVGVTSAPYFDESCGIKINFLSELKHAIQFIEDKRNNFSPRQFIIDNLSLEKQAREFLKLYTKSTWVKHEKIDKNFKLPLFWQITYEFFKKIR